MTDIKAMPNILYFIAGISLGFYLNGRMRKTSEKRGTAAPTFAETPDDELEEIQSKAHKALSERTEDRKKKILSAMKEAKKDFVVGCNLRDGKNEKGITCGEVEKMFDVSENTARRYLNLLEDEKKIKQVGKVGKSVYYILVK